MSITLELWEAEALLISLEYSKDRIRSAPDTPYSVRKENLNRLEVLAAKLRDIKRQMTQ